jgi:hypothetical protein
MRGGDAEVFSINERFGVGRRGLLTGFTNSLEGELGGVLSFLMAVSKGLALRDVVATGLCNKPELVLLTFRGELGFGEVCFLPFALGVPSLKLPISIPS